ncbi:MAG: nitroreductase family protein [Desulfocapsaceae bacterium]
MNKFFHSKAMLYILAVLLMLVFFLPDLIGPIPAVICGAVVIGFAYYIYNLWCTEKPDDSAQSNSSGSEGDHSGLTINGRIEPNRKMEKIMLLDLLRKRRSIRQYTNQKVEVEKLEILIESVLRSPSSRGLNPWEFVVVTNEDTIAELARAKTHGSSFLAGAPLAIAVCADPGKSDVWVEDTAIASLLLHLSATDLGLGSCWIQIRSRQHDDQTGSETYVKNVLGLEQDMSVEAIVAIGYSAEEKAGRDSESLLYDRISYERYGNRR